MTQVILYNYFRGVYTMDKGLLKIISLDKRLTGSHIRTFLLLFSGDPLMQSQISEILNMRKQNTHKIIKDLEILGYVKVHHTEGRNKYFQSITNSKLINPIFCGQESFNIE